MSNRFKQGCGFGLIVCGSGSTKFSECGSGSRPDPGQKVTKFFKKSKIISIFVGEGGMVMRCVVTMIKHSDQLFTENFDEYLPIKKTSSEVEVNH